MTDREQLELLMNLALNNNLSKSEMNVCFFTYQKTRTSKEVANYLNWASPNVARLLLSMFNKGLLKREQHASEKSYLYFLNEDSDLLNFKNKKR